MPCGGSGTTCPPSNGPTSPQLPALTAAFFAGRLASYSLYLGGARAFRDTSAADVMTESLTSSWGVVVEVVMLGALIALAQVDWRALRKHW